MADGAGVQTKVTSSHWGAFEVDVEGDRIVATRPFAGDPHPTSIPDILPAAVHHSSRVQRPAIRKGWLEGRRRDGRGTDEFVDLPWDEALDIAAAEIDRVRARHGIAILYDCHSIRSVIPHLFPGRLPDFNIGSNEGTTCAQEIEAAVTALCEVAEAYSTTLNGRFRGGWTTRHYGRPEQGVHAIQMELAQSTYLQDENSGWTYAPDKAAKLRPHLQTILETLADLAPTLKG